MCVWSVDLIWDGALISVCACLHVSFSWLVFPNVASLGGLNCYIAFNTWNGNLVYRLDCKYEKKYQKISKRNVHYNHNIPEFTSLESVASLLHLGSNISL